MSLVTVPELALWQGGRFTFTLLDVRRAPKRSADGDEIDGTLWRDPAFWLDWKDSVATDRPAVLYCAHGHEISQGLSCTLRVLGVDARWLQGGIAAWRDAGRPLRPIRAA